MSTGRNSLTKPHVAEQRNSNRTKLARITQNAPSTSDSSQDLHSKPLDVIYSLANSRNYLRGSKLPIILFYMPVVLRRQVQPAFAMLTVPNPSGSPSSPHWRECLFAALFGVSLHLLYYIKGHHDPKSVEIVTAHLLLIPAISIAVTVIHGLTILSLTDSFRIWVSIHLGLVTSIVLYRTLFHPLRRIPGPFWARITKIPTMAIARRGKLHELQTEWARKYGPIVRIGQYDSVPRCHCYLTLSS